MTKFNFRHSYIDPLLVRRMCRMPNRYPMAPPNLPTDTPVLNVLDPLRINFFPVRGEETDKMIANDGERLFRFRILQEPLLAHTRLDRNFAAIAETDVVFVRLNF